MCYMVHGEFPTLWHPNPSKSDIIHIISLNRTLSLNTCHRVPQFGLRKHHARRQGKGSGTPLPFWSRWHWWFSKPPNSEVSLKVGLTNGEQTFCKYHGASPSAEFGVENLVTSLAWQIDNKSIPTDSLNDPCEPQHHWLAVGGPNDMIYSTLSCVDTRWKFTGQGIYL